MLCYMACGIPTVVSPIGTNNEVLARGEVGLAALVAEAVAEIAAASGQKPSPKEMGTVIKALQAKLQAAGARAEGRVVSEMVKKALAA